MPLHDKQIPPNARCSHCAGSGWTWWEPGDSEGEPKWILCRECLGTGRTDKNGRKRQKPEGPPSS